MPTLVQLIPDVEVLLALAPEELAPTLLMLAKDGLQNEIVHPDAITDQVDGPAHSPELGYPRNRRQEAYLAVSEGWNWLKVHSLIVPDFGYNGSNGFVRLSRLGKKLADPGKFDNFVQAAAFPKSLLHPSIADKVWLDLARGDLEDAVFAAFKEVEIAVRKAGGFADTDIGVALVRKAFDKTNGKMSDMTQPEAEREALAHLFAGAIGSYKNPHSHRTVTITDARDAQEMVMLASHLLRIVDSRTPQAPAAVVT